MAIVAKAQVVQLTGFRSISAAAEGPVTLGVSSIGGERAFVWVELKSCGGKRRAGLGPAPTGRTKQRHNQRRSPHPVQCTHWTTFPQGKAFGRPQGSPLRITSRFGGGGKPPPYKVSTPEAFARPSQAQLRNCTSLQFLDSQGPVARREFRHALRFARRKCFAHPKG